MSENGYVDLVGFIRTPSKDRQTRGVCGPAQTALSGLNDDDEKHDHNVIHRDRAVLTFVAIAVSPHRLYLRGRR